MGRASVTGEGDYLAGIAQLWLNEYAISLSDSRYDSSNSASFKPLLSRSYSNLNSHSVQEQSLPHTYTPTISHSSSSRRVRFKLDNDIFNNTDSYTNNLYAEATQRQTRSTDDVRSALNQLSSRYSYNNQNRNNKLSMISSSPKSITNYHRSEYIIPIQKDVDTSHINEKTSSTKLASRSLTTQKIDVSRLQGIAPVIEAELNYAQSR
ncbi:unnamed protein product, partial [Didymodactylos carnosus]